MEYTNDETLDDNRMQTRSRKASRVVTPLVTGKTDCEEYDRGQRRSIYQPGAIPTMDGGVQKQSEHQGAKTASYEEERCVQHENNVRQPAKASLLISMIQECRKVDQLRDRHKEIIPEVKTVDGKYIEQGVKDLLQGKSSCQTDRSVIRDCGLQEKLIDW